MFIFLSRRSVGDCSVSGGLIGGHGEAATPFANGTVITRTVTLGLFISRYYRRLHCVWRRPHAPGRLVVAKGHTR